MDTQSAALSDEQVIGPDTFIYLVFGLHAFFEAETPQVPNSLRRAMNDLAFALRQDFPKTLHDFIRHCHRPIADWYPYHVHDFNPSQPLLYAGQLSEEAQEFYFALIEQMQFPSILQKEILQTQLDNYRMVELRQRLKHNYDLQAAQTMYAQVRSFVIEHSWTTNEHLHQVQPREVFHELREFYEEMPQSQVDAFIECERCGLLEWRHGDWHGIKPTYCSDHGAGSPYIRAVPNKKHLLRLTRGVHLRTFLPGRIELALFALADELQDEYPDQLLTVERYPGFDTYDLRLTFSDGDVWAIDAKDQAYPQSLATSIRMPYGEGALAYGEAFFVIPDRRMNEGGYQETLERAIGPRPNNLHITSLSEFQQRFEAKIKSLGKQRRRKKVERG